MLRPERNHLRRGRRALGHSGPRVDIEVHLDEATQLRTMAREVEEGLARTPKQLPSKYFYDERGSKLFERITELPEYYLTRAEQRLLERYAPTIARLTCPEELLELGSGSAKKTRLLIDATLARGRLERYVPIEVSSATVERSVHALAERYPELTIHAVIGDFEHHLERKSDRRHRMVALLGSTIGNFPEPEAVHFLGKMAALLGKDDWFLLGTDLVKDVRVLEAAYNDSAGVTAEFNRNILNVVNRRLGADFDLSAFAHLAVYNEAESRIESYLRSLGQQTVHITELDLDVEFADDELLWTEVSCKYTRESVERILGEAGFRLEHWFGADDGSFALSLARPLPR